MDTLIWTAAIVLTTYTWVRFCDWVLAPWMARRADNEGWEPLSEESRARLATLLRAAIDDMETKEAGK